MSARCSRDATGMCIELGLFDLVLQGEPGGAVGGIPHTAPWAVFRTPWTAVPDTMKPLC